MPYFESRLKINLEDFNKIEKTLNFCEKLGINNLILEPTSDYKNSNKDLIKKIKNFTNINIYFRFNLEPKNLNEFKKSIKNYTNFPNIISVETSTKDVQIQAAKDSRVDILSFSNENIIKTLTPGVVSLIKQNNSFIEFSLAPLMVERRTTQSKNFRNLYRLIQFILDLKPNYIISGNFVELYHLRNPRNLMSICHTLLGMPLIRAKKGFKENVELLLNRVQRRTDKNVIQDGVRLIKGGDKK